MIKRLFWDIDETLIHTFLHAPDQEHHRFTLEGGDGIYYTIVRPCAKDLINYSRELFGKENVYILTTATTDYAHEVNRFAEFGFHKSQIFAREHIRGQHYPTAYGGSSAIPHALASKDNIIVDNLHPRANSEKVSFMGIWNTYKTNYFQVKDYYGVNFPDDPFEENVKIFLKSHHDLLTQHIASGDANASPTS